MSNVAQERWKIKLKENIHRYFNREDFDLLIFELGIQDGDIHGNSNEARAKNLIEYMERRNRLPELINKLREKRPHGEWVSPIARITPTSNDPVSSIRPNIKRADQINDKQNFFQQHIWVAPVLAAIVASLLTAIFVYSGIEDLPAAENNCTNVITEYINDYKPGDAIRYNFVTTTLRNGETNESTTYSSHGFGQFQLVDNELVDRNHRAFNDDATVTAESEITLNGNGTVKIDYLAEKYDLLEDVTCSEQPFGHFISGIAIRGGGWSDFYVFSIYK